MIRILFFAQARHLTGISEISLSFQDAPCGAELWRYLLERFPGLDSLRETCRLARNCEFVSEDETFADGDEIAIIPPVSGG